MERWTYWFGWPFKQCQIIKDRTGCDFRMWPLAVLTGWPHFPVFHTRTCIRFAGTKKTGRGNEVNIRQGSTVKHVYSGINFHASCILVALVCRKISHWRDGWESIFFPSYLYSFSHFHGVYPTSFDYVSHILLFPGPTADGQKGRGQNSVREHMHSLSLRWEAWRQRLY